MFFGCVQAFFCDFGLFPNSIKHKLLFFYLSPSNYVILFAGWYMPTFRLFVAVSKNIRYFVSIFYKTKFIIHRSFQRIIFSNAMLHAKRRCTLCNDFRIDFVDFDIRQKAKIWIQQCNKAFNIFSKRSLTLVIYAAISPYDHPYVCNKILFRIFFWFIDFAFQSRKAS